MPLVGAEAKVFVIERPDERASAHDPRPCAPTGEGTSDGVEQSAKKRSRFAITVLILV